MSQRCVRILKDTNMIKYDLHFLLQIWGLFASYDPVWTFLISVPGTSDSQECTRNFGLPLNITIDQFFLLLHVTVRPSKQGSKKKIPPMLCGWNLCWGKFVHLENLLVTLCKWIARLPKYDRFSPDATCNNHSFVVFFVDWSCVILSSRCFGVVKVPPTERLDKFPPIVHSGMETDSKEKLWNNLGRSGDMPILRHRKHHLTRVHTLPLVASIPATYDHLRPKIATSRKLHFLKSFHFQLKWPSSLVKWPSEESLHSTSLFEVAQQFIILIYLLILKTARSFQCPTGFLRLRPTRPIRLPFTSPFIRTAAVVERPTWWIFRFQNIRSVKKCLLSSLIMSALESKSGGN